MIDDSMFYAKVVVESTCISRVPNKQEPPGPLQTPVKGLCRVMHIAPRGRAHSTYDYDVEANVRRVAKSGQGEIQ